MLSTRPNRLRPSRAALDEDVSVNLGEELHRFELPDLQTRQISSMDADIRLSDLEAVSSYSWINESGTPMIAVPGMPPIWSEPSLGTVLPWDKSDTVAEHQSADVVPKYPLLALVASIRQERPDYALGDIDVVTARNSLRRLLRWIRSRGKAALVREFRIDIDIVGGKTMLLTRRELRSNEPHIKNAHGHGLAFERAATRDDRDGATYMPYMGHHRIVKYGLEGMTMLVRSEVDACVQEPTTGDRDPRSLHISPHPTSRTAVSGAGIPMARSNGAPTSGPQTATGSLSENALTPGNLDDLLQGLNLNSVRQYSGSTAQSVEGMSDSIGSPTSTLFSFYEHPSAATSVGSVDISHLMDDDFEALPKVQETSRARKADVPVIRVLAQGRAVAQRDLVELTTCFDGRFPRWDELCDQLFLSGVPRVHVGFYDRAGAISAVRKFTPGYYRMAQARAKQAESYRQLAGLLRDIRQHALDRPGMKLSLACVSGRLGLYERLDGNVALPAKYLQMFESD